MIEKKRVKNLAYAKLLDTHRYVFCAVATDDLDLKCQAINIHIY